jgi:hypothetical protein
MKRNLSFALVVLAGFLTAGSASASFVAVPASAPSPSASAQPTVIKIGMTTEAVRARIGRPHQVKPAGSADVNAELWIYRRQLAPTSTQEVTSYRELPFVNPLTGVQGHMMEPVYSTVTYQVTEVTYLLMVEGRLTEWRRVFERDTRFD